MTDKPVLAEKPPCEKSNLEMSISPYFSNTHTKRGNMQQSMSGVYITRSQKQDWLMLRASG